MSIATYHTTRVRDRSQDAPPQIWTRQGAVKQNATRKRRPAMSPDNSGGAIFGCLGRVTLCADVCKISVRMDLSGSAAARPINAVIPRATNCLFTAQGLYAFQRYVFGGNLGPTASHKVFVVEVSCWNSRKSRTSGVQSRNHMAKCRAPRRRGCREVCCPT